MTEPITINGAMRALVAELEEGGIADPLAARLTLAAVWADLTRLAGETIPGDVGMLLGNNVPESPPTKLASVSRLMPRR